VCQLSGLYSISWTKEHTKIILRLIEVVIIWRNVIGLDCHVRN